MNYSVDQKKKEVIFYKAQTETCEIKRHYLNATAGTCEEMIKIVVFARENFDILKNEKWKIASHYK